MMRINRKEKTKQTASEIREGIVCHGGRYLRLLEISPSPFLLRSARERDAVAASFAAMLRTAPPRIRFKVVSVPPLNGEQMEIRRKEAATETDPRCAELQKDLDALLERVSCSGGSGRRFFISFPYCGDPSSPFQAIRASLLRDEAQFLTALSSCGNEAVRKTDEDAHVREMAGCSCPGTDPFSAGADFSDPACVKTGEAFCCFAAISSVGYNPYAAAGWINNISQAGPGIDTDIFLTRIPKERALASLRTVITRSRASLMDASDASGGYDSLTSAVESGYYLKKGLADGDDLWDLNILVTARGTSPSEAEERMESLRRTLLGMDVRLTGLKYLQEQAFRSSFLHEALDRDIFSRSRRNILTSDAACLYPFGSADISDPDGIFLGTDPVGGTPAMPDLFDTSKYKNANVFISGITGAGKTFALCLMALRMRLKHIPVIILAPEKQHEFRRLCEGAGGQFIRLGGGSPDRINVLDIYPGDAEGASLLSAKIRSLRTFFRLIVPDMTYEERQILDDALLQTYGDKGISIDNESVRRAKEMPVLSDLYDRLAAVPGSSRIASAIKLMAYGSERAFSGQTNVRTDGPFTVIGLEDMDPELLPAGMFMAMEYAWSRIKADRTQRKCLFIDEWWRLAFEPAAAAYSLEIAKTIRAYGGSLVIATQQLGDVFGAEDGKYGLGVLGSCATKIVMQLEYSDAEKVREMLDLTPSAAARIPRFRQGEALLHANGSSLMIRFEASDAEYDLITTDRRYLEERKRVHEQLAGTDAGPDAQGAGAAD